ncbi:ATPase, partial [Streptomyces sp. NPDC059627]
AALPRAVPPPAPPPGGGAHPPPPRDEFTVSQIIPEQQFQAESFSQPQLQPMRTAAELGFDDSRYIEVPDDIRDLDPVGRSLMREERRAALEAQAQPSQGTELPQAPQETSELPAYVDEFDSGRQGYGTNGTGFQEQPTGYDGQPAYQEQPQSTYDEQYYAPNGGLPQNDTFSPDAFSVNGGYPEPSYPEPAQEEPAVAQAAAAEAFPAFGEQPYQDDWPQQDGYTNGYPAQYAPEAESAQAGDVDERNRVGFDRPGSAPSNGHQLTDAGLPRRGSGGPAGTNGSGPARHAPATSPAPFAPAAPAPEPAGDNSWRSQNDERWQQASALRKPKAGGVTSSGLPRRVPKANLVEGAAESTPQGGPQVSRAPEDIRGRLSNLRRGVERGRNAGSETNGQGFGPDSTYNQER